jgi:DNA polymerase epsilon subunit 1
VAVFAEQDQKKREKWLRKWLKADRNVTSFDVRELLDWDYYKERLGGSIQKIITIPAALQHCVNPVPKIEYPPWLHKRIKAMNDKFKQKDMKHFFNVVDKPKTFEIEDL